MLKIHKPYFKLLIIPIASICGIGAFLKLVYHPNLAHAETVTYEPPKETRTMADITYMQDITPEICQNSTLNQQYTLTDVRDSKTYTVARIKNQTNDETNCWMTQNLRLVNYKLTSVDSDVKENYDLPTSTILSDTDNPKQFTTNDQYESKVYYANNPTNGAYYNWYTATAGSGTNSVVSGDAPNSICPKGWRLPTGYNGEFHALLNKLNVSTIVIPPYNFQRSSLVSDSSLVISTSGYYWSSTAQSASVVYSLRFFNDTLCLGNLSVRYEGYPIRCLARTESTPNNNVEITVNNTISLDVASEVAIEKEEGNLSTADLNVKVASNQPYSVSINANGSNADLISNTNNTTIPSNGGTLTTNVNNWGIMKPTESTYTKVTTSPELFYQATAPEVKDILFKIGISTAPDLPNGEYSTDITVTATQN